MVVEVYDGAGGRERADAIADGGDVRSIPDEGVQLLQRAEDQVFQISDGAGGQGRTQRGEVVQEFQLVFFQEDELFYRGRFVGGKGKGLFILARHFFCFFVIHDASRFLYIIWLKGKKVDDKKEEKRVLTFLRTFGIIKETKGKEDAMKKLLKEFKEFISRGNVMDLAVGMIIGAAFTAIITAVVNGILKPLINWIPVSTTGLQTVLRPAVVEEGVVVTEALILDWGAVISAVITFLLTALVLFVIVKVFNTMKKKADEAKEKAAKLLEKKEKAAPAEEAAPVEPEEPKPTVEDLLAEIRDLLKKE